MLAAERDLWIPFGFQTPISISLFRFLEEVLAPKDEGEGPFFSQFHSLSLFPFLPSVCRLLSRQTPRSLRDV